MSDNFGERMAKIEEKVEGLNGKVTDGFLTVTKQFETMNAKLDAALEKKANVWVEQFMRWLIIVVVGAVVVTILGVIGLQARL